MNRLNIKLLTLALGLMVGCGGSQGDPTPTTPPDGVEGTPTPAVGGVTYFEHIAPILERNCVGCHVEGSIAPFTLDTYDEVKALGNAIVDSVIERRMPPWGLDGSGDCNQYENGRWLANEDIQLIIDWVDGGMPRGSEADKPVVEREPVPTLARVDTTWDIGVDYQPDSALSDDYRCFLIDPGVDSDVFMTGFEVHPGNAEIVHHVVVYDLFDETNEAIAMEMDAAQEGPGYTCFGTAGTPINNVIAAWAPGTPAQFMPEGTGLHLTPGRKIAVQVHYSAIPDGASDRTTVSVQYEDRVSSPAFMGFVGDFDMVLPSAQEATYTFWEGSLSELGLPFAASVYGVFPHLHTLGTRLEMDVLDGEDASCFSRVDQWDFNWQQLSFFEKPVYFTPEQRLRISCHYDTRTRDTIIPWGDGTQDEMCLALVYLTFEEADDSVLPDSVGERVELPGGVADNFESPIQAKWATGFDGRGDFTLATQMAAAADGSVYLSLDTEATTTRLGGQLITLPGDGDGILVKVDAAGDYQWHKVFGGPLDDGLGAVEVDAQGNILVTGWFESDLDFDGYTLENQSETRDLFIAKYDAAGQFLWALPITGNDYSYVREMAVSEDGAVAITGYFYGSLAMGEQALEAKSGTSAGFLLRVSADGMPLLSTSCSSDDSCRFRDVDFLPGGDLVATGRFTGSVEFGGIEKRSAGSYDGFLVRFDADTMEADWVQTYGDTAWDYFDGLNVDADGFIYATGLFSGAMRLGDKEAYFKGGYDGFLVKFDPDGTPLWLNTFGNVSGDRGVDILPDNEGGVYVTVNYEGPVDLGGGLLHRKGGVDIGLVYFDAENGAHQWSQHFGGYAGDRYAYLESVGDTLYMAWSAYGPVSFGNQSVDISSAGGTVLFALSH